VIGEWTVDFQITDPQGTLILNAQDPVTGGYFMLDQARCSSRLPVRATVDEIPQGDGQINHKRWRGGYLAHLAIEMWETIGDGGKPACDTLLREMIDHLGLHTNALVNPRSGARLIWVPSGYSDSRMIDQAQLLTDPVMTNDGSIVSVEFDLDTPFPYYIDATEQQETWSGAGSSTDTQTVVNAGNTDFMPVFHVFGPATGFTITNNSAFDDDGNVLSLTYDSSLPGAADIDTGDFIFFDFFRNVAYRNGNLNNRKPGIDIRISDFFPLVPGANEIEVFGADALLKWNNSWA